MPEKKDQQLEDETLPVNQDQESTIASGDAPKPDAWVPAKAEDQLIGQTIADRYQVLSHIGKGGMSNVFKARDLTTNNVVALKTILPHLLEQENNRKRFQREGLSAMSLKHPNIAEVYSCDVTSQGLPFIAMEYLEGSSLSDVIAKEGRLPYERAMPIFQQIAEALGHAHAHGVVHRDLKPSNIILRDHDGKRDVVGIVDFGLAKLLPQADVQASTLTETGDVFGSPPYMSPEQCRGDKVDTRSDIYSFGCLMFEVLTGRPPLVGESALTTIMQHLNRVPPPMAEVCPSTSIPPTLEAIVFKSLSKDPASRQQTMSEVCDQLRNFLTLQQTGLEHKPATIQDRLAQIWTRNKTACQWVLAVAALIVVCSLWEWWHWIWSYPQRDWFVRFGFSATVVGLVAFGTYKLVALNNAMKSAPPIWLLEWQRQQSEHPDIDSLRNQLATTVDKLGKKKGGFDQSEQQELRLLLDALVAAGCLEEVQTSTTHGIELLRKRGRENSDTSLLLKEYLADTLAHSGLLDRAESTYRSVAEGWHETDSFTSQCRCIAQLKLADILFVQQKLTDAAQLYKTFLPRWDVLGLPHDSNYMLHTGRMSDCCCGMGELKEAEAGYHKCLSLWENAGDATNANLAFIKYSYSQLKRWQKVDLNRLETAVSTLQRIAGTDTKLAQDTSRVLTACLWSNNHFTQALQRRT